MSLISIISVLGSGGTISGTVGTLINAVSVDDFGAVGDGTTNDTAALIAAVATGSHVFIPKNKTYAITGTDGGGVAGQLAAVKLAAGQYIIGEDKLTSIIKVNGNGRGVQIGNNGMAANLTFQGAGTGAGHAFNAGLVTYGVGWVVDNCKFTAFSGNSSSIGGGGILVPQLLSFTDFKDGSTIKDCDFIANVTGLNILERGEYLNVTNIRALGNTTGIINRAGNNKFSNINAGGNGTGFSLQAGANDGHGVMSNCTLNHNTTNLAINGITLGFVFNAVMMYEGHISIISSDRISFSACHLVGVGTLTLTSNTSVKVGAECYYPTSGGDALTKSLTGTDISIV
jgi:hypothetical protein